MRVVIINYGMGNLASARRAFEECDAQVVVTENPDDLGDADRIVLPGVGAFPDGMANLRRGNWPDKIIGALENPRVALLGICLGMQLLAERGHEGAEIAGLGLIRGEVRKLEPTSATTRIPHVGWNEVHSANGHSAALLANIPDGTDFYFVHSYHLMSGERSQVLATTPYCGEFVSVVRSGNVFGTQFHPEKSSRPGFQLLRNFLSYGLLDA